MHIKVNNEPVIFEGYTILDLLTQLHIDHKGIAVAVEDSIITKGRWSDYKLSEKESVTIIRATQGG